MSTAARKRLARMLRGDEQTAFSVELTAPAGNLKLDVEGFGPVRLPVTPARARQLIGLGQPARFGRGEETLTDPEVRDTWEIPRPLVRATWDDAGPGSPGRSGRPATGRSSCPRAAATASCAARCAGSSKTRSGAPSNGRSPRSASSTSTPGSTPPSCPSPT